LGFVFKVMVSNCLIRKIFMYLTPSASSGQAPGPLTLILSHGGERRIKEGERRGAGAPLNALPYVRSVTITSLISG
jgi:hypothetical protein